MKVSFNQLFQMADNSENVKKSDVRGITFDSVLQQNNQKVNYGNSKNQVSSIGKAAAIKNAKVSDRDVQKTDNGNVQVLKQDIAETDSSEHFVQDTIQENVEVKATATEEITAAAVQDDWTGLDNMLETDAAVTVTGLSDSEAENLMETINTFLEPLQEKIQSIIKKDMDLDDEDIQKIVEQIGISMTDLTDVSNLQQFVLQNAKEEIGALLTDETLAAQFNQLLTDVNEMCQELETNQGISKEDIRDLSLVRENVMVSQNTSEEVDSTMDPDDKELGVLLEKVSVLVNESKKEHFNSNIASKGIIDNVDAEALQNEPMENNFIVVEKEDVQENTDHSSRQYSSDKQTQTKESIVTHFVQELVQARTDVEETVSNQAEQLQQMREIVTQVVEQIKIVVKADTSAMEMQLNPEKLGKVNLSVVSKNGQMTASFITENEVAKHALESQMQNLKDTLQNQGLKVDAIEVSVSDFRFEQSSNMNGEQQRQSGDNKKKSSRKIDLSMLEDGFEDLSEEDTLAAQIMIDNGNTVDYTA